MTSGIRRGPRRSQPDRLPPRVATVWLRGGALLGPVSTDLLGEDRVREMVALALLLMEWGVGERGFEIFCYVSFLFLLCQLSQMRKLT